MDHKARSIHTLAIQALKKPMQNTFASLKALADELAKDGAEELNSGMINGMKLDRRHREKSKLPFAVYLELAWHELDRIIWRD